MSVQSTFGQNSQLVTKCSTTDLTPHQLPAPKDYVRLSPLPFFFIAQCRWVWYRRFGASSRVVMYKMNKKNEFLLTILSLADGTVTLSRNVGTKPTYAAKQPRRAKISERRGERLRYGITVTCRLTFWQY